MHWTAWRIRLRSATFPKSSTGLRNDDEAWRDLSCAQTSGRSETLPQLRCGKQELIDSAYATVVCAPIFTNGSGLSTQVAIGPSEGLKYESWIVCDNLRSLHKADLTQFVGSLSWSKLVDLDDALRAALALD